MLSSQDELVIQFMALYAKVCDLQDYPDENPIYLYELAADDEQIAKICLDIVDVAGDLSRAERSMPQLFTAPVKPEFIAAWRDYEERYSVIMDCIFLAHLGIGIKPDFTTLTHGKASEHRRRLASDVARKAASAIGAAFDFCESELEFAKENGGYPEDFLDDIEKGISAWGRLANEIGLDFEGVIRRRESVLFVLIPRNVSRHYSDQERLSLLTNLQQSQNAFIYGAHFASIALLRSVIEIVLRKHYEATGGDLEEYINTARDLPRSIRGNLHGIRKLANDVLHLNDSKDSTRHRDDDSEPPLCRPCSHRRNASTSDF